MTEQPAHVESARAGRILVVDDDRNFVTLLAETLRRTGYEVSSAESAEEALAAAATAPPDLAVLDIRMPGPSGLELGALLRDQFGVPFLFLTLMDDDDAVRHATAMGALAYLVKPLDVRQCIPTIDAALARALELRRLRQNEAHLSNALQQSRLVSMAIGLLMERFRLSRDAAFERLRSEARSRRQRISDLAAELLDGVERLNTLGGAAQAQSRGRGAQG